MRTDKSLLRPIGTAARALALLAAGAAATAHGDDGIVAAAAAGGREDAARVGHVFVIVLENKGYDETFGPGSVAPYLSKTLPAQGQLLRQYYGIGHLSNDNYIAMVSGQAPNAATQSDCQVFADWAPPAVSIGLSGQAVGTGCVYPANAKTIADQLQDARLSWKAYMEDMGNDPARDGGSACAHPALNAKDGTQSAKAGDQYATRHNPFVYFHSIIDDRAGCEKHVVPLDTLAADLTQTGTTPHYVFIAPNLCNDGHDAPCVGGAPGGLVSADRFLQTWVPRILNSPAFQRDGLLIVTFDEAEAQPGQTSAPDAASCCGELPGPDSPLPGLFGPGGGRTGTVLLSRFIRPGSVNDTPYNHYALLKSIEDIFRLRHLGYAAQSGLKGFGNDVFTER